MRFDITLLSLGMAMAVQGAALARPESSSLAERVTSFVDSDSFSSSDDKENLDNLADFVKMEIDREDESTKQKREAKGKKKGVASLCIGGGEATAVAVELI